jgi:hypothetical protein
MRSIRTVAIVMGLLTAVPAASLAAPAVSRSNTASAKATSASTVVHATKGVVKFVGAQKLVIARSPQYRGEVTFVLNPSTEQVGNVTPGSTVDVRYRTEGKQAVATAVTVVRAKQAPPVPGSHH